MDEDWGTAPRKIASRSRLGGVLAPGTTRIHHIYDFGDYWEHSFIISDIRTDDRSMPYPRFIAGERNDPPKNCSGLLGFYEMLEASDDPEHLDHAYASEWLGNYQPEGVDLFPIAGILGRIATRRNAAARCHRRRR